MKYNDVEFKFKITNSNNKYGTYYICVDEIHIHSVKQIQHVTILLI